MQNVIQNHYQTMPIIAFEASRIRTLSSSIDDLIKWDQFYGSDSIFNAVSKELAFSKHPTKTPPIMVMTLQAIV
jgi:hypothetical protein